MKKSIFIVLAILFIIAIVICLYIYNVKKIENVAIKHNKQYEEYCNKKILGTELISLINKAIDYNEKNSVEKQENTIYYINNNTNSIQITVKFLDNDKIIKMENIAEKQTENFIKFFATATFKCNDIKYHKQTKNVQSMYFEQINN
ncbi:unknown [Clostridium sp. CAG:508]|jgi:lipopolysaccharide export LptBFGC system permease protein LptF|nr:unknown [Clostridium sp. CAG:508]